jgi:pilus assembly protein CpaC
MKKKHGHLKSGVLAGLRFAAFALIATGALIATSPRPAQAQDLRVALGASGAVKPIVITPGFTMTVEVDETYSDMVVGNPGVADVFPLTNKSLYIQGNAPGATNVSFYNPEKQLLGTIIVQVRVDFGELQDAIDNAVPSSNVKVSNVNNRIRLSGEVRDGVDLGRVLDIARQYAAADDQVVNAVRVTDPQQVQLDVRILEVSRSAGRELGIGLRNSLAGGTNGTGGAVAGTSGLASASVPFGSFVGNLLSVAGNEIDVVINTLEAKGLARRLANPTLITSNGVEANFTVGGEVPITVSSTDANGNVATSTGYRDYGVKLGFRPVVLDNSMISLSVKPEVSDIDTSLNVNGQPAFISRKADTTVSSAFQKQETDLVIVVTPHLVRPATPGQPIVTPMDTTRSSNDVEMFLMGMLEVDRDMIKGFRNGEGIVGPYGHIIDLEFDDALIAKK